MSHDAGTVSEALLAHEQLFSSLVARFPFLQKRPGNVDDNAAVDVPSVRLLEFAFALRDELGFDMLADLAGCDWGELARPRFGIVCHFHKITAREYLRVAVNAPDDLAPVLPSLTSLYPSANWFEREAFDLFGIRFDGHPDLRRILLWEEYPGHPLRKDFPLAGPSVELPQP
ncbi:MAG: NADH-quinone oxidoreductase subunit C [Puniceicoccales bacterium]|jgi:NADH-quinone oxidoreductase subunit C|nr:NADH-quinone oxidoreductase subunit C [Puniceicoccales bacterium]